MSDQNDRSIKDMFKQVYDMWEKTAGEQLERVARSQTFLTAMAQNLDQSLNISQRVKEMTQSTLNMMNLPTQQDVATLTRQIKTMRSTLDEINHKLDKLERSRAGATKEKAKAKQAEKSGKAKKSSKAKK
jgi:hypothetical protein